MAAVSVPCLAPARPATHLLPGHYFDIIGNMENKAAVIRLAALAHDTRLALFRRLVQAGPDGLTPGTLGAELALAPATLSFHLKELTQAGLLLARQEGRFIHYAPDFAAIGELLGFLTDNCCGGQPCGVENASCCP